MSANHALFSRDRRTSILSRSEEDNRIARKNRKEWSVSKSQVLLERQPDADEVRLLICWLFCCLIVGCSVNCCVLLFPETFRETSETKESAAGRQTSHSFAVPGGLIPAQSAEPSQPVACLATHAKHSQKLQYVHGHTPFQDITCPLQN